VCVAWIAAISPGLVKEQQSYVLGSVHDPLLAQALMSLFLDPDHSIDPAFTANAGNTLLGCVNGYRTNSVGCQRLHGQVKQAALEVGSRGVWELPYVGKALQRQPLLKGVRRAVMYQQVSKAPTSWLGRGQSANQQPSANLSSTLAAGWRHSKGNSRVWMLTTYKSSVCAA
jgi:hypothetical protein